MNNKMEFDEAFKVEGEIDMILSFCESGVDIERIMDQVNKFDPSNHHDRLFEKATVRNEQGDQLLKDHFYVLTKKQWPASDLHRFLKFLADEVDWGKKEAVQLMMRVNSENNKEQWDWFVLGRGIQEKVSD